MPNKKNEVSSGQWPSLQQFNPVPYTYNKSIYVFWFIRSRWNSSSDLRSMTGFFLLSYRGLSQDNRNTSLSICYENLSLLDWDTTKSVSVLSFGSIGNPTGRFVPWGKNIQQVSDLVTSISFDLCSISQVNTPLCTCYSIKTEMADFVKVERVRHLRSSALGAV